MVVVQALRINGGSFVLISFCLYTNQLWHEVLVISGGQISVVVTFTNMNVCW